MTAATIIAILLSVLLEVIAEARSKGEDIDMPTLLADAKSRAIARGVAVDEVEQAVGLILSTGAVP